MNTSHLLFKVGEHVLAMPATIVQAVHDSLDVQQVAGTKQWFKGLAVAEGKLLPVTDLGEFLGQRSATGHTIELSESVGIAGFTVDEVFGLSDAVAERQDVVESSPANMVVTPWIIRDSERVHRVLDVAAMMARPAFTDIKEAASV